MKLAEFSQTDLVNAQPAMGALFNLLGALALILQVWIQCRKLFGKSPPMHEQIAKLRDEIMHAAASHEAEDERELTRLETKIDGVDRDVRGLKESISVNGELRKQTMLIHIEDVRTKLDNKIDLQTTALNQKIDRSNEAQTKLLIAAIERHA